MPWKIKFMPILQIQLSNHDQYFCSTLKGLLGVFSNCIVRLSVSSKFRSSLSAQKYKHSIPINPSILLIAVGDKKSTANSVKQRTISMPPPPCDEGGAYCFAHIDQFLC